MKDSRIKAWSVAAACTVIMAFIYGIVYNTTGVFITHVTKSLGFSRGQFSGVFTVIGLALMFVSPFVGKIAKKIGLKRTILLGCVMASLGYIGYSFSKSIVQFYAFSIIIGIGGGISTAVPLQTVINSWFVQKKALAMGIMLAGTSAGGIISATGSNMLIMNFGWSKAYMLIGILMLLVSIPTVVFFITVTPDEKGMKPYGYQENSKNGMASKGAKTGITFAESKKTKLFWLMLLCIGFISFGATGTHQHLIPFLVDSGYSQTAAAAGLSAVLAMGIFAKMASGMIFDKKGLKIGFLILMTLQIVCTGMLFVIDNQIVLYVFIVLWAFASALPPLVAPIIVSSFFGNRDFITIRGIASVASAITGSLAPILAGKAYDMTGSYLPAWRIFMVLEALTIVLVLIAIKMSDKKNYASAVAAEGKVQ